MDDPMKVTLPPSHPPTPFSSQYVKNHLMILNQFQYILKATETSTCALQEFLVVAEARYATYLDTIRSLGGTQAQILPPWDVAIVSHAHHLSPRIFLGEVWRKAPEPRGPTSSMLRDFPVDRLASLIEKGFWSDAESEQTWARMHPHIPYQLWPSLPDASNLAAPTLHTISIRCPFDACQSQIHVSSWQWLQLRQTCGYVKCPACERKVYQGNICLANLLNDCRRFAATANSRDPVLLGCSEPVFEPPKWSNRPKMDAHLRAWAASISYPGAVNLEEDTVKTVTELLGIRSEFLRCRISTRTAYECSPWPDFGVNLLDAVVRLRFYIDIFTSSTWYGHKAGDFDNAIARYTKFMKILRKLVYRPDAEEFYTLTPTSDITLCWITHLLSCRYDSWCTTHVGYFVDFKSAQGLLRKRGAVQMTRSLWEKEFGESYEEIDEHISELNNAIVNQDGISVSEHEYLRKHMETTAVGQDEPKHRPRFPRMSQSSLVNLRNSVNTLSITALQKNFVDRGVLQRSRTSNVKLGQQASPYMPLLKSSSFRLLKFQHKDRDGALHFDLGEFDLDRPPEYRALSYVWMKPWKVDVDDPGTHTVFCNGYQVLGSGNGFALLERLSKIMSPSYLWMDAICINQSDLDERSQQVGVMHEIYSKSVGVIGWLGPGEDLGDCADDFRWASSTFRLAVEKAYGSIEIFGDIRRANDLPALSDDRFWRTIGLGGELVRLQRATFFSSSCRWFDRKWIAQEIVLSPKIHLLCGSTWLSWDGIVTLGALFAGDWKDFVQGAHIPGTGDVGRSYFRSIGHRARELHLIRERLHHGLGFDTFGEDCATEANRILVSTMSLLYHCRTMECSDNRDKIYAILGMVQLLLQKEGIDRPQMISVNYEEGYTAADLYLQFTKLVLEHLDSLTILSFVEARQLRSVAGLPSWVPDFAGVLGMGPIINKAPKHRPYDIWAGNTLDGRKVVLRNNQLLLRGIKLARIDDTTETVAFKGPITWLKLGLCGGDLKRADGLSRAETLMWAELMREPEDPPPGTTRESMKRSFYHRWLMLLGSQRNMIKYKINHYAVNPINDDCEWYSDQLSRTVEDLWERVETVLLDFQAEIEDGEMPSLEACNELPEWLDAMWFLLPHSDHDRLCRSKWQDVVNLSLPIESHCTENLYFRQLFAMEDAQQKRLLGVGPWDIELNDEVWLLNGSRVPFILRTVQGRPGVYTLVGDCYVHGVMYGQYFKENPGITLEQLDTIILE